MDLGPYVDSLRAALAASAAMGGEDARALAERLAAPMESATRLMLLEALSEAAGAITSEVAPRSVDLVLRGGVPKFVVSAPPEEPDNIDAAPPVAPKTPSDEDDSEMTRINLRLPRDLKDRAEEAARAAGLSVNAWLVRSATHALDGPAPVSPQQRRAPRGGDRFTGWVS